MGGGALPLRPFVLAIILVAVVGVGACHRPQSREPDAAAMAAAIEKARQEDAEADRRMREGAAQQELERRAAEQATVDERVAQDNRRHAKELQFEERLRSVMIDPASMQIKNQRLNGKGTALCAEVSGKNKQGIYVGFRRAVVTDYLISIELDPEDNDRPPQERFASVAKQTSCF